MSMTINIVIQIHTLRNKLNIRDDKILLEAERNITALRILELKQNAPKGKLDFKYLCRPQAVLNNKK
jgi:fido (protein-threonine AMPylation protein)